MLLLDVLVCVCVCVCVFAKETGDGYGLFAQIPCKPLFPLRALREAFRVKTAAFMLSC